MDLAEIVSPLAVEEFLNTYFQSRIFHAAGDSARFEQCYRARAVQALAQRLERSLETSVRAEMHANQNDSAPLCLEHDCFFLQLAGTAAHRVCAGEATPEDKTAWEGSLHAGHCLYVPRGFWNQAEPSGADAACLEIRIDNPTGADLLDFVVRHLKRQKVFQSPVPRFATPAVQADYLATLRKTTGQMWRLPALLDGFTRHRNARAAPLAASGLRWSEHLSEEHVIALATPRRLEILRADKDTVYFVSNRKQYRFPEDAMPLLSFLCDREPVSIARFREEMTPEFDREEISDFLAVLAGDGIISLHPPGSDG